jgi:hypothetical protein
VTQALAPGHLRLLLSFHFLVGLAQLGGQLPHFFLEPVDHLQAFVRGMAKVVAGKG